MPAATGPRPARLADAPLRLIELPDGGLLIDVRADAGQPASDRAHPDAAGQPGTDRADPDHADPDAVGRPGAQRRNGGAGGDGASALADGGRAARPPDQVNWVELAGRTLVGLGLLMVAFAAFQLWGTALIQWRAQRSVEAALEARLHPPPAAASLHQLERQAADDRAGTTSGQAVNQPPPAAPPTPVTMGQPVGRIEIPAIGLSKVFLEGVGRNILRDGPGHYPGTALPGHAGNTGIAGHRTTHGAPFQDLDQLEPGDEITLETPEGLFRYSVEGHPAADGTTRGHLIVDPGDVAVLADIGGNRLTLTACHPKFSARQRIVVTAMLVGPALIPPAPVPVTVDQPTAGGPVGFGSAGAGGPVEAGTAGAGAPVAIPAATAPATPGTDTASPATDTATATAATDTTETAASATTGGPVAPAELPATVGVGAGALHASLGWQPDELEPTVLWATVTAMVAHGAWALGRLWRRWRAYGLAFPLATPALFLCFVHLDRLLPAF